MMRAQNRYSDRAEAIPNLAGTVQLFGGNNPGVVLGRTCSSGPALTGWTVKHFKKWTICCLFKDNALGFSFSGLKTGLAWVPLTAYPASTRVPMISRLKQLFGSSAASDPSAKGKTSGKRDLILFVDDEMEVRSIARITLEQHGYRMIEAEDGLQALELFTKRRREISLVVTDVLMPNMDGLSLASKLHKLDADLPILLLSGHVLEEDLWAPGNSRLRYLMKPYRLADLQDAVTDLIGPGTNPPMASDPPAG
jgi:CheY-like chemotaxis protein